MGEGSLTPQPASHLKAPGRHSCNPLNSAGMLTITDFILVLHRYYRSPLVRSGRGAPRAPLWAGGREFREPGARGAPL